MGLNTTASSFPIRRSTCNLSSPLQNSPLVNILRIALSAESTAACSWRRQAGLGVCTVIPRVFTCGEPALGALGYSCYVKIPDEISRALHTVCTVIYTTKGWCKGYPTQNKCFTLMLCQWLCREQRLGRAGKQGVGLQQPSSPSEPPDPWAVTVGLVPTQGRCLGSGLTRMSVHEVPVVRQLPPR